MAILSTYLALESLKWDVKCSLQELHLQVQLPNEGHSE